MARHYIEFNLILSYLRIFNREYRILKGRQTIADPKVKEVIGLVFLVYRVKLEVSI